MSPEVLNELTLFDFSDMASMTEWSSINDVVMGGRSQGGVRWSDAGRMVFFGSVSFENNGGFSSIRSSNGEYDLSGYKGILITAQGDGKRYKFTVRTDASHDGVSYQQGFFSQANKLTEYFLPFQEFIPSYHGRRLLNHPPLDPLAIKRFGFIISDHQEGPFSLEIANISAVASTLYDGGKKT